MAIHNLLLDTVEPCYIKLEEKTLILEFSEYLT